MSKPKILILDDQPSMRAILSHALNQFFECDVAETAEEAIKLACKRKYEFALLDILLNNSSMDGIDVAGTITERGINIPVGFLTSFDKDGLDASARTRLDKLQNVKFYAVKPVMPNALYDMITNAMVKKA